MSVSGHVRFRQLTGGTSYLSDIRHGHGRFPIERKCLEQRIDGEIVDRDRG